MSTVVNIDFIVGPHRLGVLYSAFPMTTEIAVQVRDHCMEHFPDITFLGYNLNKLDTSRLTTDLLTVAKDLQEKAKHLTPRHICVVQKDEHNRLLFNELCRRDALLNRVTVIDKASLFSVVTNEDT